MGDARAAKPRGLPWQQKMGTLKEMDGAFKLRGEVNPGVLYGPRSGLIDVECDSTEAQAALVELFDCEPPIAPTFSSRRGRHRIIRFDADLNAIDNATIHWPDPTRGPLEIKLGANGKGAQSIWPPSSTNGRRREWLDGLSYFECMTPELPSE